MSVEVIVYLLTTMVLLGFGFGGIRLYQIRKSLERQVIQNMDIILLLRTQNSHLEQLKRESL
ncbi:hypothetical protein JCM19233_6555 [Vibrio astriarenae]|uniref:Uncharacterized protein n=1 Tax=Vibrio astriarenae TaxID=1481923 RepID=A0A7Z2YG06_9VIBR|nr:hypothetical protein [Vibrio astriarenae]QIA65645.1 hypothetical protein GT360_19155 [Vibrio astriarenae]GAL15533.1 hypothetical protein JCM19233_6555 [Vibrio sp. C7]